MELEDSQPSKRRRRSSDSTGKVDECTIIRNPRFWFDDGNVILQVQHTQFRLHRSVLSFHSGIMKDCFRCPQPADSADSVEGCPVVHLTDSEQDIENMCQLFYGAWQAFPETIHPSHILTMIRMGRKYEISHLKGAMTWLRQLFPRDLDLWMESISKAQELTEEHPGFLFDLLNLVHEMGIQSILPAAFLALCMNHSLVEILSGVERPDKTLATLAPAVMKDCMLGRATSITDFLQDIRGKICVDQTDYRLPHPDWCGCKDDCRSAVTNIFGKLSDLAVGGSCVDIPVQPSYFSQLPESHTEVIHLLCDECMYKFDDFFVSCQENWWSNLPKSFNLPQQDWLLIKDAFDGTNDET